MTVVDRLAAPFSAHARLRVGLHLIERGKGGKGLRHLARAARRDCVEAQYRVGRCYLEGRAVPPSRIEAMRWLEQAAQRGHAQAQLLMAALFVQGVGYETDASRTIASLFATTRTPTLITKRRCRGPVVPRSKGWPRHRRCSGIS